MIGLNYWKYKGHIYCIASTNVQVKCTKTRQWLPAIQYARVGEESKTFVRPATEFYERFKQVK